MPRGSRLASGPGDRQQSVNVISLQTLKTGLLVILLIAPLVPGRLGASQPRRWSISNYSEFLKGDFEGVSLTSDGRLVLSPRLDSLYDSGEAFIYSAVLDRTGNLFLGTGNNGRIFRVPARGGGSEWARLEDSGVYTLAVDSQNVLYAGTGPDGKVYRFNAQGEPGVFFDPEDKYIWSLTFDSQNNLLVATGPKGIIYKVDSDGRSEVFYDSEETHVVALGWDLNRNLLAGTAPGGLLLRLSAAGNPFVLVDSPLEELKALTVDRYGHIFAAALSGGTPRSAAPKPPESPVARAETATTTTTTTAESTVQVPGKSAGGKLEIYRIDREGLVQTLYTSSEMLAFDLLIRDDGNLLIATGNKGRLLSLSPNRVVTLLVEAPEEQITKLLEGQGRIFVATSNLGRSFELLSQPSEKGIYLSDVLDAGMSAMWGTIRWNVSSPAPARPQIFTRSGNTSNPNTTWSAWSGPYENPEGSPIQSSPARYLQWKVEFPGEGRPGAFVSHSNALERVEVSYLQSNLPPELNSITVHAPGVSFAKFPTTNPSGGVPPGGPDGAHERSLPRSIRDLESPRMTPPPRPIYIPGARSISWSASDPNDDDLSYSLYYRTPQMETWQLIEKDLSDTHYTLDTVSFADGLYYVRVTASDLPGNPPERALESELSSKPFVIANTPPRIEWGNPQVQGQEALLGFQVITSASPLYQVEYSVALQPWQILLPEDGIPDGTRESFVLRLRDLGSGSHVVRVRAVDTAGNIFTGQQTVTVP